MVALAACGGGGHRAGSQGGGSPGTTGSGASAATSPPAGQASGKIINPSGFCSLLSAAEISQVVGQTMPAPQMSAQGGGETDCDSNSPGGRVGLVSFSLFLVDSACTAGEAPSQACLSATSDAFATDRAYDSQHNGPLQDITGLGQQAYCFSKNDSVAGPEATVSVLQGWIRITVFTDTCAHSQALASLLLSRL